MSARLTEAPCSSSTCTRERGGIAGRWPARLERARVLARGSQGARRSAQIARPPAGERRERPARTPQPPLGGIRPRRRGAHLRDVEKAIEARGREGRRAVRVDRIDVTPLQKHAHDVEGRRLKVLHLAYGEQERRAVRAAARLVRAGYGVEHELDEPRHDRELARHARLVERQRTRALACRARAPRRRVRVAEEIKPTRDRALEQPDALQLLEGVAKLLTREEERCFVEANATAPAAAQLTAHAIDERHGAREERRRERRRARA